MVFDLADYLKRTSRLVWDDLDLARFVAAPLPATSLPCLRDLHDVDASCGALPREHRPARPGGVMGSWATTHAA